jgi:hypothetical protein
MNMDELPDLRSDEDVDALMARLRARITPPAPSNPQIGMSHTGAPPSGATSPALAEFLGAQGEATETMARALRVLAEAIEDLAIDETASRSRRKRR